MRRATAAESALDTGFRAALRRMRAGGRIQSVDREVSTEFEIASIMQRLDGGPAVLFPKVAGHSMPVFGNFLASQGNCEAAFGCDYRAIRTFFARALDHPLAPELVTDVPAQQHVHRGDFDLGRLLPVLRHTDDDSGRFITGGIVIVRDPDSGVYNASYHRLQVVGPQRTAIKLDFGRHLRLAWERARERGQPLPVVVCIGTDIAVHYTAATMGAQMPEHADELAVAGGLAGRPLPVARALTQDLLFPAATEIVLEGVIRTDTTVREGPFAEFIGYLSPEGDAPVFDVTAVTHRDDPVYHAVNGTGRETVMLRKYVMEASLLKALNAAVPIVVDAEMTAGGLHRFHAVISVRKRNAQHEGFQKNAMMVAFATLKDLDLCIMVDDDIDIRNPHDVEYALATRMEASRDLVLVPAARGHEYVRIGDNGIRTKLGIDATVPFGEEARFRRAAFRPVEIDPTILRADGQGGPGWLAGADD